MAICSISYTNKSIERKIKKFKMFKSILQGWPNHGSSESSWWLFEPFEKLKNYVGNQENDFMQQPFFCREHHDFGMRIGNTRLI